MPSLLPIGGTIILNGSPAGAAVVVPLSAGGFAAVYHISPSSDAFTLYDDNFQPLTDETLITSDDVATPQAAALNSGQFVVTWLNQDQSIEAIIYNADGSVAPDVNNDIPTQPITLVNPTDISVGLSAPKVVGNAFGGFTTIWQDKAAINGVAGTVFIRSYDGFGQPVGDPIIVQPPPAPANETSVIGDFRIAVLGDGTVIVAVQAQIDGVELIMYSINGGPLIDLAGGDPDYLYTNPQITPLASSGGFVITYDFVNPNLVGSASTDANWTTGGSVFTSSGHRHDFAIGTTVTTTTNGTFAVDPAVITPLADGGFVVTFEPLTSPLGGGYLVDAQQFDGFGNAVGPVVLVTPQGIQPSVATSANGVVLDTYVFGTKIYLQAYSSAPTPLGPEPVGTSFGLNSVVSANSPGVAPLSAGGFVIVYQDQNSNSWAQIYDYNRQPVGTAFEVAANGTQPVVASQTNGTFLVAWSTGTQILGALYDNDGTLLRGPFSMSGDPASLPVLAPAINAMHDGGFSLAYETDLQTGGSHLVTIQQFDGLGNAVGSSVSKSYAPTNPLAPPKIAALEAQLFGSVTVMGIGDQIVAAFVSSPPTAGGSAGIAGQMLRTLFQSSSTPTVNTVSVTASGDGVSRANAQVATLNDGNVVVVWDEASTTGVWQVVGQLMTSAGEFVGGQFSITTALSINLPAGMIALSALPDGGFLVTYDPGNSSLASQRYDATGTALGGPVLVSATGQSQAVTTVLSDGTVLLASNNVAAGGMLTGQTFSLAPIVMNWTGSSGTDLGVAANWDIDAVPDGGHAMQFGLVNGGTLTGAASAATATFTGLGPWVLSNETVTLVQGLTQQGGLQISGGSVTAGGTAAVGGAVLASDAAQVSFAATTVGTSAGQTAALALTGIGTSWINTGSGGAGGLRAGASTTPVAGSGSISVSLGATLSSADTDILGGTAGSEGDLSITNGGTVNDAGLVVGDAGTGTVTINSGILTDSGSLTVGQTAGAQGSMVISGAGAVVTAAGPVVIGQAGSGALTIRNQGSALTGGAGQGLDVAQSIGGAGSITVTDAQSRLTNAGSFVIGDAGIAGLSIQAGGTVITNPGTAAGLAGAVIANTTAASGSSVNVSGAGSVWQIGGALIVGNDGQGLLNVSQGASVNAASADLAAGASGAGVISVAGTGSALTLTGSLTVGDRAAGELSILNGATVSALNVTIGNASSLSSGNIDIEGAGSRLIIGTGGSLNIGVAGGGSGVLTVGPGATLSFDGAIVESGHASLNNNGGVVDPVSFEYTTQSNAGIGWNGYDLYLGNIGAVQVSSGTGTWLTPMMLTGTSTADAADHIAAFDTGQWQLSQGGTLIINANTVDAGQAIVFEDATDTLVIGQIVNGGSAGVGGQEPTIEAGAMNLLQAGGFDAQIWGYQAGDTIAFSNMIVASDSIVNGNTLDLFDASHTQLGSLTFYTKNGAHAASTLAMQAAAAQIAPPCFASGTGIATTRGLIAVESVHPGDHVCTILGGDTAEVVWVGRRSVNCLRHPDPSKVWPVRVMAHAFGRNTPVKDLVLSPDHAVYVDGALIPIRLLINGRNVRQESVDRVTYHHIELARHDVLLANGMPAESYLDAGDRARFSNVGEVVTLYPDFAAKAWEMQGCAPLVQAGPILATVRKRLAAEAAPRRRQSRKTAKPGNTWPG